MKIKLITDGSSTMPLEMLKKENIGFLESMVVIYEKFYRELTEMDFEDFVSKLYDFDPYPTTTQVTPEDALNEFKKAIDEGYDEILYLGLTPKVSSQMNVARLAAKTLKKQIKIHIYPTDLNCGSQGAMTYNAWKLLKKGKSAEEIMEYLDSIKEQVYTIGLTEDVKTLFKTGRVKRGSIKGIMVSLLKMKPIAHLTVEDGWLGYGASTSYEGAIQKMVEEIESRTDPEKKYNLFMSDALNKELVKTYAEKIQKVRKIKEVFYWDMSPVQALTSGKKATIATIAPVVEE